MRLGDEPLRSGTLEPAGEIVTLDEDERLVELKLGPSRSPITTGTALIPKGPVGDKVLRAAVHRYAEHTRRMHPDLCRFVSDAVYEGRLQAEETTARQRLDIDVRRDPAALASTGLRFVDVQHVGRTQRSPEEAERLAVTYRALLDGRWTDRLGHSHQIGLQDILVVSPYNMQVELLKRTLPEGACVGTVDKFQGQEAPIVLVSMATSSGDDLPRNIEFLYSRNRLNVAISRAKCLAVIYANPRLLEISCSTIDQMVLVDGLCWAKEFADRQAEEA